MEDSILPSIYLSIATGIFTAGFGAYKETRYLSVYSIFVTIGTVIITMLFTSTSSISFYVWLPFSIAGILIIIRDVRKRAKNKYIAFLFGSKTIGGVTLFLGLTTNDFVMSIFEPIYSTVSEISGVELLTGLDLQITVHIIGILIILTIIHVTGRIIGVLHKHHKFLF
ncbi:hypothetical protein [Nitrosopumilus sp.]|uniref:hypothetical protein n=1 Tax=Nitrosopumilus sp. TaxID=2024843 RepID=UPI003D0E5C13